MEIKAKSGSIPRRHYFDGGEADDQTVAANTKRLQVVIQNLGTETLYVKRQVAGDTDPAAADDFDIILPACAVAEDGTSFPYIMENWHGSISLLASSGNVNAIVSELETA